MEAQLYFRRDIYFSRVGNGDASQSRGEYKRERIRYTEILSKRRRYEIVIGGNFADIFVEGWKPFVTRTRINEEIANKNRP